MREVYGAVNVTDMSKELTKAYEVFRGSFFILLLGAGAEALLVLQAHRPSPEFMNTTFG